MIVLSLDLGTRTTGWAVYDNGELVSSDVHRHKGSDFIERGLNFLEVLEVLCEFYKPNDVVIEDLKVYTTPDTLKKLATVHGMVIAKVSKFAKVHYFGPTVWRKGISSSLNTSRDLSKKRAIAIAQPFCGKAPLTDDEAEAILLGKFFVNSIKNY